MIHPEKRFIDLTWGEVVAELDSRYGQPNAILGLKGSGQENLTPFINIKECAALTGYKVGYIRQLIFRKEIPFYKTENRKPIRFRRSEIQDWLLGKKITPIDERADDYINSRKIK
jgi:excisionase family DNA binding protein